MGRTDDRLPVVDEQRLPARCAEIESEIHVANSCAQRCQPEKPA
jgi:hypothetical protein